jgi:predicted AAA+ superfamily ATPase
MWIEREISDNLRVRADERPVVLVTGSRQVGKTSLLEKTFPAYEYVSLDLPALAEEAEGSGAEFLSRHRRPVIIDEVQYAPALFRALKAVVDAERNRNGRFLLTGSQKLTLMQGVSESLAGRVGIVELHSLSLGEIERHVGRSIDGAAVLDWIWRGGYPELVAKELSPRRFFSDYVATYLERDVRQAVQVRSLRDFDRFLRLCALRSGQLLSMSSLAGDVGVSPNTVRSWLSVLEASNIVMLLEPYYRNLGKRLVKTPKLYFLDTGLVCFLVGLDGPDAVRKSGLLGALFETLVLGQIVRHYANRGEPRDLYFYRDHHGVEVDFVIPVGDKLRLIECKWSDSPDTTTRGFKEIEALVGSANVLDRSVVTPRRGRRVAGGVSVVDAVEPILAG